MNIYVLLKEHLTQKKKLRFQMAKLMKMVQNSLLTHMMNMPLKKRFKYVMNMVEKSLL